MAKFQSLLSFLFLTICLIISGCNALTTKSSYTDDELDSILDIQQQADAAYTAGNWESASNLYQALLKQHPSHSTSWYRLGNSYSELGKSDEAIEAYQQAVELDPANTKAWHNLGVIQLRAATQTFVQMQEHATETDQYAKRGRFVVNSVGKILQEGFGISVEAETK